MKYKRKYLFIILIIFILIGLIFVGVFELKKINHKNSKIEIETNNEFNLNEDQIDFIKPLVGLEAKNIYILDNPLRLEGNFKIPKDTITRYINYFLKKSKNKDIENVKVMIDKNGLYLTAEYKLLNYFKTPITINIVPKLTENKDLKINLKDIKLLNLSLSDDMIDAIVDSWFSGVDNVIVKDSDIIIDKKILYNTNINSILVEKDYLLTNLSVLIK